ASRNPLLLDTELAQLKVAHEQMVATTPGLEGPEAIKAGRELQKLQSHVVTATINSVAYEHPGQAEAMIEKYGKQGLLTPEEQEKLRSDMRGAERSKRSDFYLQKAMRNDQEQQASRDLERQFH